MPQHFGPVKNLYKVLFWTQLSVLQMSNYFLILLVNIIKHVASVDVIYDYMRYDPNFLQEYEKKESILL